MKRPYNKKSIDYIEKVFKEAGGNSRKLGLIKYELTCRKTSRARDLLEKVNAELARNRAASRSTELPDRPLTDKSPDRSVANSSEPSTTSERPPTTPKVALGPRPSIENKPSQVLKAWTALEVLSPQSYNRDEDLTSGDKSLIARFANGALPWQQGEKSRPNKRLFYEVVLGSLDLEPAISGLLKLYSDRRPEAPAMRGNAIIATVMLDEKGVPLDDEASVAVSSFAWGLPIAMRGTLPALGSWSEKEQDLRSSLKKLITHYDEKGDVKPVDQACLSNAFEIFVKQLNLSEHVVRAPSFAIRRFEYFRSATPPEPGLLNSFFLDDLSVAADLADSHALPQAVRGFLGLDKPERRTDLLQDAAGLVDLLQPKHTPLGRWPAKGRFPLALLQQAAVNATKDPLMANGILAVNGPPGTGKTTLLRDVVAARIVERAIEMRTFKDPNTAFRPTQQSVQRKGAKLVLHHLDERLKGFEMVVASSNNKAVENVSRELPSRDSVANDAEGLRYFETISSSCLGMDTWGLIAAVLGNAGNRYAFAKSFWRDEEYGLATYLDHVCGIAQTVTEKDEQGVPTKRLRHIIDLEKPPESKAEAKVRWAEACRAFDAALKRSQDQTTDLQQIHEHMVRLNEIEHQIAEDRRMLEQIEANLPRLGLELTAKDEACRLAEAEVRRTEQETADHRVLRPGLFARSLRTTRFQLWKRKDYEFTHQRAAAVEQFEAARRAADASRVTLHDAEAQQAHLNQQIYRLSDEQYRLTQLLREASSRYGGVVPDGAFLTLPHEAKQKSNLWFDEAGNRVRDDVFEAAMALHRAFIDAAADPLRQNLAVFVESFGTRSIGSAQKDELISDLWASFFLVVPVVSTTFASVRRMLGNVPPETLGWLLVDEAGQAVPQAAIGAMMRTRKTVVVGDPLQIEPVVMLPNSLTEEICSRFGVDAQRFNAPEASVQTLADAASAYCARFPVTSGYRDVGAPLLVHRRCDSPMFDISNELAYSCLMVQAKNPSGGVENSKWLDVEVPSRSDKWCEKEGEILLEEIRALRSSGADPDFYVVTPFVAVQNNLRRVLKNSDVLTDWVENPVGWTNEHVGTVHTVQGREASNVFFVLGAQSVDHAGARQWAGGAPNLVNVAVTRAKSHLCVIGNRRLWKTAGAFSVLDSHIPKSPTSED